MTVACPLNSAGMSVEVVRTMIAWAPSRGARQHPSRIAKSPKNAGAELAAKPNRQIA